MACVLRGLMSEDDEAFVDNEQRFAVAKSCMKRCCLHPLVSPSPKILAQPTSAALSR
jgi:hypothetical protein